MQPKEKVIQHEDPGKLWEVVGAEMLTLCNQNYLYIVDYYNKWSVIKKVEDLSADSPVLACKVNFFSRIWLTKENNVRCRW